VGRGHMQIVVLDKLDYCSSMRSLDNVKDHPNFKVRDPHSSTPDLVAPPPPKTLIAGALMP